MVSDNRDFQRLHLTGSVLFFIIAFVTVFSLGGYFFGAGLLAVFSAAFGYVTRGRLNPTPR